MRLIFVCAWVAVGPVLAEEALEVTPGAKTAAIAETAEAASEGIGLFGMLEIRPSYDTEGDSGYTDNTARLGYRFTPDVAIDYTQYFSTPLTEMGLFGEGSFARLQWDSVISNDEQTLSAGWELRVELPTNALLREAGSLTSLRNDFKIDWAPLPGLYVGLRESPVFRFYETNGYWTYDENDNDLAVANPWFENRLALEAYWEIGAGFALYVPLTLSSIRNRRFADEARFDDTWEYQLTTWPELTYRLNPNLYVGLSYSSGNWLEPDLSGFQWGEAFSSGAAQIILGATL